MAEKKNVTIGIDLGTTYSAVAYVDEHGEARIIPNSQSERITPSVVLFKETENEVVVGQAAKDEIELHPEQVIDFVKREMGKKKEEVRALDNDGVPKPYNFWGRMLSPEEVSMFILKKLKLDAESALGFPITDAVITVPAYFNDTERQATKNAGMMAGLNVKHILNEPTAAALAYGVMRADKPQTIFVFDLGGGTFDVTILKIELLGKNKEIRMIQTNGDHRLGGKDWDDRIIYYVAEQFQFEHGLFPLEDVEARADLRVRAEKAKKDLSSKNVTTIVCNAHGKKAKIELTKEKFEELTSDLLGRCNALCDLVLNEAGISWNGIDTILLAGGSTRMPMVQEMLKQKCGKALRTDLVNPDECVALGAAIQGSILVLESSDQKQQPQEVIDKLGSIKARDVTSHRLGTAAYDVDDKLKVFTIIRKGEPVPCTFTESFATRHDNQRSVRFEIKEGESDDPNLVPTIQEVNLPINNPLPKGAPIDVTYQLSADGMLLVIAKDVTNNQQIRVEVDRKGILNAEEVKDGLALANRIKVTG